MSTWLKACYRMDCINIMPNSEGGSSGECKLQDIYIAKKGCTEYINKSCKHCKKDIIEMVKPEALK